jgi:hypothetical protein
VGVQEEERSLYSPLESLLGALEPFYNGVMKTKKPISKKWVFIYSGPFFLPLEWLKG